jgi:uncharacterized protein YjbI with pentapeptide repeats
MTINTISKLIKYLKSTVGSKDSFEVKHKTFSIVKRKTFKDVDFSDFSWMGEYRKCVFINCSFENIFGFFLDLKGCKFKNCRFKNSRFSHFDFTTPDTSWDNIHFIKSKFENVRFDEGHMYNIYFDECDFEKLDLWLERTINVNFINCSIDKSFITSTEYYDQSKIYGDDLLDLFFDNGRIYDSVFSGGDLRNSSFLDVSIFKGVFINCKLDKHTFQSTKDLPYPSYASIDLQTILKSDDLDSSILKKYFNIHAPDIKKIALGITSEINFKSVFISYSFKDKSFANLLNDQLTKNGVKTFLWEKDAPGGKLLEDIMEINIKNHDRILFIASQYSIKSKACQFELSQARKKQEATWTNDFFVLHIDNYLFEVEKNKIRPISKANEYWSNIKEIRRVNSMNFSEFNSGNFNRDKFESAVLDIITELKIN